MIFKNFSEIMRVMSIPMKIRMKPDAVWKRDMANSSPKRYAAEVIMVMRTMFRRSKIVNPRSRTPIIRMGDAEVMKARKTANVAKVNREYIPEHARSIVRDTWFPRDVVSASIGGP